MEGMDPSTKLTSSTMLGLIYGQVGDSELLFDVVLDFGGRPVIKVRSRAPRAESFQAPCGACLVVQLFEHPDALWLAQAVIFGGQIPMIQYSPIEPLVSADGRASMPDLAAVSLECVAEAVQDAMDDRERSQR